jgi:hypothetical protein
MSELTFHYNCNLKIKKARGSNLGGDKIFRAGPDRPWGREIRHNVLEIIKKKSLLVK